MDNFFEEEEEIERKFLQELKKIPREEEEEFIGELLTLTAVCLHKL